MVMGATVFGYVVANVSTLVQVVHHTQYTLPPFLICHSNIHSLHTPPPSLVVQSFNEQEAVVSKIITELTEYMSDHRCTHTIMGEVSGYYRNLFKHKTLFDEAKILPRLHCRLRTKILMAQNEDVISGGYLLFSPHPPTHPHPSHIHNTHIMNTS